MNTDRIYAEQVASQYAHKSTSKTIALRKLDRRAKLPAEAFAFTFGTAGALILGAGMCLSMNVIGPGTFTMTVLGCILGVLGLFIACVNYFLYKRILEHSRRKYAYDIVKLAKEIIEQPEN